MCQCGGGNRRAAQSPQQAQVPSVIPTVQESTNQQLVQQQQDIQSLQQSIQKAMISRRKYGNGIAR